MREGHEEVGIGFPKNINGRKVWNGCSLGLKGRQ